MSGNHCWTTSLKNAFGYHEFDLSEKMLFGLGEGASFFYWYMKGMLSPVIGTRYGKNDSLIITCKRLGGDAILFETASINRGYEELKKILLTGNPAIVFTDMALLPYLGLPEAAHFGAHTIVIYGLDEKKDEVFVSDASLQPNIITIEELKEARNSKYKPYPPKNKILKITYPKELKDLKEGIIDSIRICCDRMLNPPIKNMGLAGIQKWAELVPKWPEQFKGLHLYGCLLSTYIFIEESGSDRGAYRKTYAQFLKESSEIIGNPELLDVVKLFEDSALAWTNVGYAGLPDSWPTLKKIRELSKEKNEIFYKQGPKSQEKMPKINEEVKINMHKAAEELDNASIKQKKMLFDNIRDLILVVYDKDKKAFKNLNEVITK